MSGNNMDSLNLALGKRKSRDCYCFVTETNRSGRQYIKNGAKVMAMTLSIQAHSMQLDILDDDTESGNVSLLNMHDANSAFDAKIQFANDFFWKYGDGPFYERFPRLILRYPKIIAYMQRVRALRQGSAVNTDDLELRTWQVEVQPGRA